MKCNNCKKYIKVQNYCGFCGVKTEKKNSKILPIFGIITVLTIGSAFSNRSNEIVENNRSPITQPTNSIKTVPNFIVNNTPPPYTNLIPNYTPSKEIFYSISSSTFQSYNPPSNFNATTCISPCGDGSCSRSTGRGTCSHHGGVSGGSTKKRK